jgi:hypothetical protein
MNNYYEVFPLAFLVLFVPNDCLWFPQVLNEKLSLFAPKFFWDG